MCPPTFYIFMYSLPIYRKVRDRVCANTEKKCSNAKVAATIAAERSELGAKKKLEESSDAYNKAKENLAVVQANVPPQCKKGQE